MDILKGVSKKEVTGSMMDSMLMSQHIETEHYKLCISRDATKTWYGYQPHGYWSEVINGRIDVGNRGGTGDDVELYISNSGGGTGDDWELDSVLNFIEAYKDCHRRIKNHADEVAHIKARREISIEYWEFVASEKRAKCAEIELKHPILSDKELRKVIRLAANLGKDGTLKWTAIDRSACELVDHERNIKRHGIHFYRGRTPDTQRDILNSLSGDTVAINIVVDGFC